MKAIGFTRSLPITDAESLVDVEMAKPTTSGRDLLVKVTAVSVNPADTQQRMRVPDGTTEPQILGWDVAGVVESVGPQVTRFQPGDAVWYAGSIVRPGANSEYHLVDERLVGTKPDSLDFAQAAALPLTALTAWEGLFDRLGLKLDPTAHTGQRILVIDDLRPETLEQLEGNTAHKMQVGCTQQFGIIGVEDASHHWEHD